MFSANIPHPDLTLEEAFNRLPSIIRELAEEWIADGSAVSTQEINAGLCADFAHEAATRLSPSWITQDDLGLYDISIAGLMKSEDGFTDGMPFDRDLLTTHWPKIQPPEGLDWDDLDQLSKDAGFFDGTHIWLTLGGRHYDAEAPDGVDSPFELPFFQRVIASWLSSRETAPAPGV